MKVQIALKLEEMNHAEMLQSSDFYISSMTGNNYFKAAEVVAQVTKVKNSSTALKTATMLPATDTKTNTVDKARDVLNRDVTKLKNMVQDIANDPAVADSDRENIVLSAGMNMKAQKHRSQRIFSVTHNGISGSVILTAKGGAKAHEWQYTEDLDNYANREATSTTTVAKTEIKGLKRGIEYAFFHKAIFTGEDTEWEGPVCYIVN